MNIIYIIACILYLIICFIIGCCLNYIIKLKEQLEDDKEAFIEIYDLFKDFNKQNQKIVSHMSKVINITENINKQNIDLIDILNNDLEYIKNKLN